jgi:hypothetical protein
VDGSRRNIPYLKKGKRASGCPFSVLPKFRGTERGGKGQSSLWVVHVLDLGFDEGGAPNDRLLVSVQIGSTASIRRLERHWRKVVGDAGIRFFHSKHYRNFHKGEFAGMSWTRRRRLLKTLAALIHKHTDAGITAWVDTKLFDGAVSKLVRSRHTTPYTFAVCMCLAATHLYKESVRRGDERVNLLIAEGHKHRSQALDRLTELKRDGRLKIETIAVGTMKEFGILQAADMLAYSEWQKLVGGGDLEIYYALHRPGSRYRTLVFDCDMDMIESLCRGVNEWEVAKKAFGARLHEPDTVV